MVNSLHVGFCSAPPVTNASAKLRVLVRVLIWGLMYVWHLQEPIIIGFLGVLWFSSSSLFKSLVNFSVQLEISTILTLVKLLAMLSIATMLW